MVAGVKRTTLDAAQTGQELVGDMSVAAEVQRSRSAGGEAVRCSKRLCLVLADFVMVSREVCHVERDAAFAQAVGHAAAPMVDRFKGNTVARD